MTNAFWNNFLRALEVEPREAKLIQGASGIQHPVIAAGLDERRQRLVIVCQELEARAAAMMQADIQAAFRSVKVLIARPILLSLPREVREIFTDKLEADLEANGLNGLILAGELNNYISNITRSPSALAVADHSDCDWMFMQFYQLQVQLMNIGEAYLQAAKEKSPNAKNKILNQRALLMNNALQADPLEQDRKAGLCGIPLYDFSQADVERFQTNCDVEEIKDVLQRYNLLQYFFPPADHLALGLIDREYDVNATQILDQVLAAPNLGHPFGNSEIISTPFSIIDIVDELKERGLVVEGEIGLEITGEGKSIRSSVRFKPREGTLSKILNRLSFNIDLKDIFKGGG